MRYMASPTEDEIQDGSAADKHRHRKQSRTYVTPATRDVSLEGQKESEEDGASYGKRHPINET
jgi:hypothetical protein